MMTKAFAITFMLVCVVLAIPTSLRVFQDGALYMLPPLIMQITCFGVNAYVLFSQFKTK